MAASTPAAKTSRLAADPLLSGPVQARLGQDWSPEQIAVRLRRGRTDGPRRRVFHETIYRTVFHAARPSWVNGRGSTCALAARSATPASPAAEARAEDG